MKNLSVHPGRSVHLTSKDLGPKTKLVPSGQYEPAGVSFSPSIRGALEGVPYFYNVSGSDSASSKDWEERKKWAKRKSIWTVYTPVRTRKAIVPKTIDDYGRTKERRVLGKIQVRRLGKIKVGVKGSKWTYKWVEKE